MARTWLITGSSRGLGREIAQAVLDQGDNAVATARRPWQLDYLVARYGGRGRGGGPRVPDPPPLAARFPRGALRRPGSGRGPRRHRLGGGAQGRPGGGG